MSTEIYRTPDICLMPQTVLSNTSDQKVEFDSISDGLQSL